MMLNLTPGVMTRVGGWRGKGKGDTEGPGSRIQSTYSLLGGLHSARELSGAGLRVNLKTENLHTPSYGSDKVSQGSCFVCVGGEVTGRDGAERVEGLKDRGRLRK